MKRHSSIVFILCMKLLVALVVQSASATPSHNYLSDDCKKLLTDHKIEKPSYNLFKLVNDQSNYLPVIISRLDKDVKLYEPNQALEAGVDGLREIKKIIKKSKKLLKINGKLIFEIGKSQLNEVIRILKKNKFYINEICNDLQSYPRVIVSTKLF